ncbi:hypothetical protein PVW48_18955 [Dinoroseobacter sp. PD6]|uniref:hypothetical protein n=1 Tax=Dinoroseobacter sp. PD6 TaxID=3028384 RepID=UPI00237B8C6C|nr:hypothetical protein [Dinoroseobacter sp. PD6]MDD9718844.1 hypothetical protein [Dinoroseobacter sp. PD6]
MNALGPDNAFWIDGEWCAWDSIVDPDEVTHSRLEELEREAELRFRYPRADLTLVPYFNDLLLLAKSYFHDTGRHLNVYGDIGELFGALHYGIKLHRNYAQGSDGKLGNEFVEIKTLSPARNDDQASVRLENRHFSKLLVVRILPDFSVSGRMIDRCDLPRRGGKALRIRWSNMPPSP